MDSFYHVLQTVTQKNWQKDRPEESDSDQFKSLHNIHVYIYRMMTANENNVNKIWMNIQKSFFIQLHFSFI